MPAQRIRRSLTLALAALLLSANLAAASTPPSVTVVDSINPGADDSWAMDISDSVAMGDWLYFAATDPVYGRELFRSNGTTTERVTLISAAAEGSDPGQLYVVGDWLYFAANDGVHGRELWRSDGTSGGTTLVADLNALSSGAADSNPEPVGQLNGDFYYSADDGVHGRDLWSWNGTTNTMHEIAAGAANSSPTDGINYLTYLYFAAADESGERNVWRTDGSTSEVIFPGTNGIANPSWFVVNESWLYVTENLGHVSSHPGRSLYKIGSALSANVVYPPWDVDPDPQWTVSLNGTMYFTVDDGVHGRELWSSDGNPDRTKLVADLRVGTESSSPYFLTPFGDWLYFTADDGTHGRELYRTNGTTTTRLTDIYAGGSSSPELLTPLGSWLYFKAYEPTSGYTLYRSLGTTVQHVPMPSADLGIDCDCYDSAFTTVGSKLFFTVHSDTIGHEFAYLDEPSVALPETNRDTAPWSIALALLAAFTAAGSVFVCRATDRQ